MTAAAISALVRELPTRERASLAVEIIDSLGEAVLEDAELTSLAVERDAEMESGAVAALSYADFVAGLDRRPES